MWLQVVVTYQISDHLSLVRLVFRVGLSSCIKGVSFGNQFSWTREIQNHSILYYVPRQCESCGILKSSQELCNSKDERC